MGIRFRQLDDQAEELIMRFLDQREPVFFDED
jgi:hypothetical protein